MSHAILLPALFDHLRDEWKTDPAIVAEDDTWEPESDAERDVVRALVRIRGECSIGPNEMARRLGVPCGLLARLEEGTYPPYDDLIARYAKALGKFTVPLPYQPTRGDPATGWTCDEIELDDSGEPRFRAIPAMRGSIGEIIDRHFADLTRHGCIYIPDRNEKTPVADLVFNHDQVIRNILTGHSAVAESGAKGHRQLRISYGVPSGVTRALKRMLAAVEARSSKRYLKASLALTDEARALLSQSLDEMREIGLSLGEQSADRIGPTWDDPYWIKRRRQIEGAIGLINAGRPSVEWRDECAREIVALWSELSGEPIKSPESSQRNPKLCELGEMPAFTREVADLYAPYGLLNAMPGDSGSRWFRILAPLLEKKA